LETASRLKIFTTGFEDFLVGISVERYEVRIARSRKNEILSERQQGEVITAVNLGGPPS